MEILRFDEFQKVDESLPSKHNLNQLKRLRKISKGVDIGDRISDMNKEGRNISWIRNPIDTGVETQEDYTKSSRKKFKIKKVSGF